MALCLDQTTGELTPLNRDFSGPAFDLTYAWQITAASKLSAVTHSVRITPSYQASAKLSFDAYFEWLQRSYFSNVYTTVNNLPPGTTRLDNSHNAGLDMLWNPRRWVQLLLAFAREHRDSTIAE